jgi:histidinol-phosphate/aromatic aminotransferase/cobyric acid decarboxylase-like protein
LKKLLDTKVPVLVDEAYIELSNMESCSDLCPIYPNLFILRTFSKGFGAAGCRVGYIISQSENIQNLSKLKPMYEISGLSSKYIEFILDNFKTYKRYLKNTLRQKNKLVSKLKKYYTIVDTQSSWFFIESSPTVNEILKNNNVAYRKVILPGSDEEWIKFNYDLKIKNSKLEKMLKNGNRE